MPDMNEFFFLFLSKNTALMNKGIIYLILSRKKPRKPTPDFGVELDCSQELSMELEKAVRSKGCTILFRTHGIRFGEALILCYPSSSKVPAEYSPRS